ncbi:MAG: hypothetical protein HG450_000350 [Clostridiales bacterium]|nr:hypothetical protein [Clostridiales bacterium]
MRNYFGKKVIYFVVQIIILIIVVVVLKVNRGFNKYNYSNYNNMTQEQRQAEAQKRLLEIVGKYRKAQLEEFYKEANTRDWAVVADINIRSKFYKIVLDIYKNEKLDKQDKAFLSGFIEGILEYDEGIDDAKDLKAEMQAAIK